MKSHIKGVKLLTGYDLASANVDKSTDNMGNFEMGIKNAELVLLCIG